MKKNILLFSHEFPPKIGGAGTVAYTTASALSDDEDINVTVLTSNSGKKRSEKKYKLIEVKTIPKLRSFLYWNVIKKLDLDKFDKIILNDMRAVVAAVLFFDDNLIKKSIVYLHGSEPEKVFKDNNKLFKLLNFRKKYIKFLKKCSSIIAVSEFMKIKFLRFSSLNEIADKIYTIYNGIDTNIFYHRPIDLYKKYNIPKETKLILSAGRIIKDKGYYEQYNILKKIIHEGHKYHWIIAGDGIYKKNLIEMSTQDGLNEYITFAGSLDKDLMSEHYSSVDIFWQLSNYEESLGLVYIEAALCGCPAIGNNNAGAVEAILNNKTGFLVDNSEECYNILRNQKFKDIKLNSKRSIEFLQKFSIDKVINSLKALL